MGTFGFSYVGLAFLLLLFIPNGLWAKSPPEGYAELEKNESKWLRLLERAGQILCTCCALCFSNFNLRGFSPWTLILLAAFFLLGVYGGVVWPVLASLVLGAGHIGIHLKHREEVLGWTRA